MTEPGREDENEAREFAKSYRAFLEWVHRQPDAGTDHPLVTLVRDHLSDRADRSVVGNEMPVFEHVNLQVALDAWMTEPGRSVQVHGVALPPHYESPTLQQIVYGQHLGPVGVGTPDLVDLPSGPGRTTACLRRAVLLVEDGRGAYVVMVAGPDRHARPSVTIEVAGLETEAAQEVLRDLARLRNQLNVYRGQLVELSAGDDGGLALAFPLLPRTERDDVVLPLETLHRIERHALGVRTHRDALLRAGQHLKRGLLLFGPPGTGKTHTTRYLVQHMPGSTVLMLSGRSLHAVGSITALARELAPSVVVLEDVDLVAEDRGYGPGPQPVLFTLLDAMDGAAADADLLFLLTTNRADLLEPALAARPGRVDVAVEVPLPDAVGRRRLLEVYTRQVPLALTDAELDRVVARMEGVTASFVKELVRRAVLESLQVGRNVDEPLRADVVLSALDDLLSGSQAVTRALLGGQGPAAARGAGGHGAVGWLPSPAAVPGLAPGAGHDVVEFTPYDEN